MDITADFLYKTMQELVELGYRVCGSDEERRAAEYIANAFKKAGLIDISYEPFQTRFYEPRSALLTVTVKGEQYEFPCSPIWFTRGGEVSAEAIPIGLGAPRDFRDVDLQGKVVVVESRILLNYYPTHSLLETYHQAQEKGAGAYIAWIDAPYEIVPRYNHLKEDEPPGEIPGVLLCRGDGMFLNDLLHRYPGEVSATVKLDASERMTETGDVVGYLPGSDDVIVVGSHYDSVYAGAVDNAGANAGLIALAAHAVSLDKDRPTIVFCAHPGHEVNIGAREWVKNHRDLIERAFFYFSIDGFGSTGFTWGSDGVIPTGSDEKRGISVSDNPLILRIAIEAVKEFGLLPAAYVPASDIVFNRDLEGRFYELAVPFMMIIGKPIWYHSLADTVDKATPDQLHRSFLAHARILEKIIEAGSEAIKKSDRGARNEVISSFMPKKSRTAGVGEKRSASFGFIPEPALAGEPVLFFINDFSNPDEVVLDIEWHFGDGNSANGPVVPHVYEKEGRYTVSVSAVDTAGFRSTFERVLWVHT